MDNKYEFTDEIKIVGDHVLHRIRAVRAFGHVKPGDLGGWIESENNLSHREACWVSHEARVYGAALVCGDAHVFNSAQVYGHARLCGNVQVYGTAQVFGNAEVCGDAQIQSLEDYTCIKNFWSSGRNITFTRSDGMWTAGCFHGTGEELIKKAYSDSKLKGRCYEIIVRAVEKCMNELEAKHEQTNAEKDARLQ